MQPRDLKRLASQRDVQARIVSDGCRDYLVEVVTGTGAGMLRERTGRLARFRSLGETHQLLRRCGVEDAVLRHRIAQDEASGDGAAPFHDQPIRIAS
jgi:hypothetical protein